MVVKKNDIVIKTNKNNQEKRIDKKRKLLVFTSTFNDKICISFSRSVKK